MNVSPSASVIDLRSARESLNRTGGGRTIAYTSPNVELRLEVFNSPGPGDVRVEETDLVYLALDGAGVLGIENDELVALVPGEATVVPGSKRHVLLGNPTLILLVVAQPG